MCENQTSLPGVPRPQKRDDGNDGEEGERVTQARLKVVDRAQLLLRTVDVERLIPEDHPARAIWEFVGRLDLSGYTDQVRSVTGGAGRPAFDPQLLVSLWVYSYSQSVVSARAVERLCEHHPAYQWLTGMQSISAHTLSDFRIIHGEILNELFVQALGVLSADGLITLERVMLDGTKVRANASSSGFRRKPTVEECLEQAREALEALEAQTEEESNRQMRAAQQRARRERQERLESALKEYDKLKAAKSRIDRVSTTDPDARIMKQAEGGSAPNYNVQVSTDAAHGLIVDIEATQAGSDYQQLTPAVERIEQSMQRAPEQMVVDGGYISSHNIGEMAKRSIDLIGPESENKSAKANRSKSYKHYGVSEEYEASKFVFDAETNTYVCPQGKHLRYDAKQESHGTKRYRYKASKQDCQTCPAKDQCCPRTRNGRSIERSELLPEIAEFRKKMQTDEAKAIYKTRSQVAEFPNLWIKTKFGLRQFSVRGLAKVHIESQWVALTYDILQWIRLRWRPKMVSALAPS
ncbi:MAG: IS1182 family transposase [Rhodothermia bacterium]